MKTKLNGHSNGKAALRPADNPSVATRMVVVLHTVSEKVGGPGGFTRNRTFWANGLCLEDDGTTLKVRLEGTTATMGTMLSIDKMKGEWKLRYPQ